MRRAQLHDFVTNLVRSTFEGPNADVAQALLADQEAFGRLCYRLNEAGLDTPEGIENAWRSRVVDSLDDSTLDKIVDGGFESPCAFLASLV